MGDAVSSLAVTTELEAVNLILEAKGESPIAVGDLTDTLNVSIVAARQRLRNVTRKLMTEGWHFNTEGRVKGIEISLDVSNKIPLTADMLHVEVWGGSIDAHVARRGSFLYNLDDATDVFTAAVKLVVVRLISFEDAPEAFRNYAAIKAAREEQDASLSSERLHKWGTQDEAEARRLFLITDSQAEKYNLKDGHLVWRTTKRGMTSNPIHYWT